MADKFWQQSSFKDFVSSIKSGKSSDGDDNPSVTPSPFKATATGRIGAKTGTSPKFIVATAMAGRQPSIEALSDKIVSYATAISNLSKSIKVPTLSLDMPIGSTLYLDRERNEFTHRKTDTPIFLQVNDDQTRSFTFEEMKDANTRNQPAVFDTEVATAIMEDYKNFLDSYTTVVYNQTGGQKLFDPLDLEELEKGRREGKIEADFLDNPMTVDMNAGIGRQPAGRTVSLTKQPSGFMRFINWTGNWTRGATQRAIDVAKGTPTTLGVDLFNDPTPYKIVGLVGQAAATIFGAVVKGARFIGSRGKASQLKGWLGNAEFEGSVASSVKALEDSIDEAIASKDEDPMAFQSFKDMGDYAVKQGRLMGEIILGTEQDMANLAMSDLTKKQMVIDMFNSAIADLDLTNPEQYRQALDKIVEAHDLESTIGTYDINATWTGMSDPEKDKQFKYLLAQVELQTGKWSTPEMREQLRSYVADPAIEFTGQVFMDVSNLLNLPANFVFSDDALKAYAKAMNITNVADKQLDNLILTSALRLPAKAADLALGGDIKQMGKVFEFADLFKPGATIKPNALDAHVIRTALHNMQFGSDSPLLRLSNRQIGNFIFSTSTDLINNVFGGATAILRAYPQGELDDIIKMGKEIAQLRKAGTTDVDDIIRIIQEGGQYSPGISSTKRIMDVWRWTLLKDPLDAKNDWGRIFTDTFGAARNNRIFSTTKHLKDKININDLTKMTDDVEINKILTEASSLAPDQQRKFVGNQIVDLATRRANASFTSDEFAQNVGALFSESYKESHTVYSGEFSRFMDDQLRGITDKYLTKKAGTHVVTEGKNAGKVIQNKNGWTVARDLLRKFHETKDFLFDGWMKNILSIQPKHWGVQQPFEQGITHYLSGSGGVKSRLHDYFTNTPRLLDAIDEMPIEGHTGFAAAFDVSRDIDSVKFVDGLKRFYAENPNAWLPTPGSYRLYFNESMRKASEQTYANMFKALEIDDVVEQKEILDKAKGRLFGKITSSSGAEIPVFMGKPFYNVKQQLLDIRASAYDAGGSMASANEMITKAKIAQENYLTNLRFVKDSVFNEMATTARAQMIADGMTESAADDMIENTKRIWEHSGGNANRFVRNMKVASMGNTPVTYATLPDGWESMVMGMDMQEKTNFFETTRRQLNTYLTGLKVTGQDVTPENIHEFFVRVIDDIKKEVDEVLNPTGIEGWSTFGEGFIKRPISADTQKLLDDIDANGIENSKYVKKATVTSEGVDEKAFGDRNWEGIIPSGKQADSAFVRVKEIDDRISSLTKELRDEHNSLTQKLLSNTATDQDRKTIAALERKMESIENTEVRTLTDQELFQGLNIFNKNSAASGFGIIPDSPYSRELIKRHPDLSHTEAKAINKIESSSAELQYTNTLKTILAENGIEIEGKTVQQAIDELNESVRPIGWKSPQIRQEDALRAIQESAPLDSIARPQISNDDLIKNYWADEVHRQADLQRNVGYVPGEENLRGGIGDASIAQALEKNPDNPLILPKDYYEDTVGKTRGIVRNLEVQLEANPTDETAKQLRDFVYGEIDNDQRFQAYLMNNEKGFLQRIYPGFKVGTVEEGDDLHELFKESGLIGGIAYSQRAKYFDELNNAILNDTPLPAPMTIGDNLRTWGIDAIPNEDGFGIKAFTFMRQNGAGVVVFDDTTPFYRAMQNYTYFNMKNMEVWNAPLSTPVDQITEIAKLSQPVGTLNFPLERVPMARVEFMSAFLSKPYFEDKSLWYYLEPFMEGTGEGVMDSDDVIRHLRNAAELNKDNENIAREINKLANLVEHADNYFQHNIIKVKPGTYEIPVIPANAPDTVRAIAHQRIKNVSQVQGMENALKVWEESVVRQSNDGLLTLKPVIAEGDAVNKAARTFANGLVDMEDKLWFGGEISGFPVEGAIPFTKQRMRVGTETVVDQFAKGVVPFWNFSTRGAVTWARFTIEHPQIMRLYQKYMNLSRGTAIKNGLVNRLGQPLPSTRGKMPIPGLGIFWDKEAWISPFTVASPFLYYWFPPVAIEKYDDEDPNMTDPQKGIANMLSWMRSRGVNISPIIDIALSTSLVGVEDRFTTQSALEKTAYFIATSFVPTTLIPPFIWNAIDSVIDRKFNIFSNQRDNVSANNTVRPQVEWIDSLVENKILEDYLGRIRNSDATEEDKIMMVGYVNRMLREREDNPDYRKYLADVRNTEYAKSVTGFFTGVYPQFYSPATVELTAMREQYNILVSSINDEVGRMLIYPKSTPEDLYKKRSDLRYQTAEGSLLQIRADTSWVTDDLGNPLVGDARRKDIVQTFDAEIERNTMDNMIQEALDKADLARRELALGMDYKDPRYAEIRRQQIQDILRVQAQFPDVESDWNYWYVGYKPESMIRDQFTRNMMFIVSSFRPVWAKGDEEYADYQRRVQEWEQNIPTLVQEVMPIFATELIKNPIEAYAGQDVLGQIEPALANINIDSFRKWEMDMDSAPEALLKAYETLYSDFFFEEVWGVKGKANQQLALEAFERAHPKPTQAELIAWVQENYGRWTTHELVTAMQTPAGAQRDIMDVEEAVDRGKSDIELMWDEAWDTRMWLDKSNRRDFENAYVSLGGDARDLDLMYDAEGGADAIPFIKWNATGGFEEVSGLIKQAADQIGLQPPTGSALKVRAEAERLNEQFNDMVKLRFGENFSEVVNRYSFGMDSFQRRQYAKDYPLEYQAIQEYFKLKDQFAKQNPIWAEYYTSSGGGAKYYGYSGRSSRRSGGRSVARSGNQFVPVGMRSTQDANTLLAPENLGKGGVAGMPKLPTQFWEKTTIDLRSEIYRFVNGDAQLSKAAVGFLTRQADRYPEYKPEIDKLLAEEEVTAT